jgi:hypothetical protein
LIYFSDLHITLLKRGKAATCHFSKEFCENPGNVITDRKEGIKIQKRIANALPVFKRIL